MASSPTVLERLPHCAPKSSPAVEPRRQAAGVGPVLAPVGLERRARIEHRPGLGALAERLRVPQREAGPHALVDALPPQGEGAHPYALEPVPTGGRLAQPLGEAGEVGVGPGLIVPSSLCGGVTEAGPPLALALGDGAGERLEGMEPGFPLEGGGDGDEGVGVPGPAQDRVHQPADVQDHAAHAGDVLEEGRVALPERAGRARDVAAVEPVEVDLDPAVGVDRLGPARRHWLGPAPRSTGGQRGELPSILPGSTSPSLSSLYSSPISRSRYCPYSFFSML